MFYFMVNFEIANYSNDSTPFSTKLEGRPVVDELESSSLILFTWLKNNYMKTNTGKSHLLLTGKNNLTANINGNVMESEHSKVLVVITIGSNLSFNKHVNNLCKNVSGKLNSPARILS